MLVPIFHEQAAVLAFPWSVSSSSLWTLDILWFKATRVFTFNCDLTPWMPFRTHPYVSFYVIRMLRYKIAVRTLDSARCWAFFIFSLSLTRILHGWLCFKLWFSIQILNRSFISIKIWIGCLSSIGRFHWVIQVIKGLDRILPNYGHKAAMTMPFERTIVSWMESYVTTASPH